MQIGKDSLTLILCAFFAYLVPVPTLSNEMYHISSIPIISQCPKPLYPLKLWLSNSSLAIKFIAS